MRTKVTKEVINGVKTLIDAGTTLNNISKVFDVSPSTVFNIKKTDYNIKMYKQLVSDQLDAFKEKMSKTKNGTKEVISTNKNTKSVDVSYNYRDMHNVLNSVNSKLIEMTETEKIKQRGLSKFSKVLADSVEETLQRVRHIDKVLTKVFPKI